MMRRRFYGEAPLEAYPLVAPIHEDGTYLTPNEIATQLGSVNIIDKYNESGLPNKKYAYTINNSLTTFKTPNIDGDFWYHETIGGVEQKTKYSKNVAVTPTSGSTERYVIACGDMTEANCINGGEWLFSGKCNSAYCNGNKSLYSIHNNSITDFKTFAFSSTSNLSGKFTPKNIKNISQYLFSNSSITSFDLSNDVKIIDRRAFQNCSKLNNITIPNNITSIDKEAFQGAGCTDITIDTNALIIIGYMSNLNKVTLGDNATDWHLNNNVLYHSNGSEKELVWIPKSYSGDITIEDGTNTICIYACRSVSLQNIYFSDSIRVIDNYALNIQFINNGLPSQLETIGTYALNRIRIKDDFILPDNIQSIGAQAFRNIVDVEGTKNKYSLIIGSNIPNLGEQQFDGYTFKKIVSKALTPPIASDSTFLFSDNTNVYVPSSSIELYKSTQYWGMSADDKYFKNIYPMDIVNDLSDVSNPINGNYYFTETENKLYIYNNGFTIV